MRAGDSVRVAVHLSEQEYFQEGGGSLRNVYGPFRIALSDVGDSVDFGRIVVERTVFENEKRAIVGNIEFEVSTDTSSIARGLLEDNGGSSAYNLGLPLASFWIKADQLKPKQDAWFTIRVLQEDTVVSKKCPKLRVTLSQGGGK